MSALQVGKKFKLYNKETKNRVFVEITAENIEQATAYNNLPGESKTWVFEDEYTGALNDLLEATIVFNTIDGIVTITDVQIMYNGGTRSRKVKRSKQSKKRFTTHRRRSSKRKVRKARTTRRR